MNHEAMIRATDIKEARSRLNSTGAAATMALFSREPLLAQEIANHTNWLIQFLRRCGLKESEVEKVQVALARFALEPLLTLDAAHLRLMDDLLPGEDLRPVRLIPPDPALRKTFAVTSLRPGDVQALAPEFKKLAAQVFLMDHEGEITTAMRQAGIQTLKMLLAKKDADHGTGS